MVKIKLISSLKWIAGFDVKEIHISEPTSIRALIDLDLPNERVMVIINGTQGGTLDSIVDNSDSVLLSPVFGGG